MMKLILLCVMAAVLVGCGKKPLPKSNMPLKQELPQELVVYDMYGNNDEIQLPELTIKRVRSVTLNINDFEKDLLVSRDLTEAEFFDQKISDLVNDNNVNYKTYKLPEFDLINNFKLKSKKSINDFHNPTLKIYLDLGGRHLDLINLHEAKFLLNSGNKTIASLTLDLNTRPLKLENIELNFNIKDVKGLVESLELYKNLYIVVEDFSGDRAGTKVNFSDLYNKILRDYSEIIIANKAKILRSFYKEKSVDDFLFNQKISDNGLVRFEKKHEKILIAKDLVRESFQIKILDKVVSIDLNKPIIFELNGKKKLRSFTDQIRNHSYTVKGICEQIRNRDKLCEYTDITCESKHRIITNESIAPLNFMSENIYLSFDRQTVDFGVIDNKILDTVYVIKAKAMSETGNGFAYYNLASVENINSILEKAKKKGIILGINLTLNGSPSTRYGYLDDNCQNPYKVSIDKSFNYIADFNLNFNYKAFVR